MIMDYECGVDRQNGIYSARQMSTSADVWPMSGTYRRGLCMRLASFLRRGLLRDLIMNTRVYTVAVPLCSQLIVQQVDTEQNPQGHNPCVHLKGVSQQAMILTSQADVSYRSV